MDDVWNGVNTIQRMTRFRNDCGVAGMLRAITARFRGSPRWLIVDVELLRLLR